MTGSGNLFDQPNDGTDRLLLALGTKLDCFEAALGAKIDRVEATIIARIDRSEAAVRADIAAVRTEHVLVRWMLGAVPALQAMIGAKLLLH